MTASYPNLPLIEERFKNHEKVKAILLDKLAEEREAGHEFFGYFTFDFVCDVFQQGFPNTACIFDNGCVSGQAMSIQYITVIREVITGTYGVFGGNRLAYIVRNPNEAFFEDLRNRNMANLRVARTRYNDYEGGN